MAEFKNLQRPLKLGELELKNRVLMASMTRNRGVVPNEDSIKYYEQRSGAGLILYENLFIEPQGSEFLRAPGIWSKKQIEALKKITDAIHAKGGVVFAQLGHCGRAQHEAHNCGIAPPAPSPIRARTGKFRLLKGEPEYSEPEEIVDPEDYIKLIAKAAGNAKLAGFDGVELCASDGYLPAQFLESHSNKRTDKYGGSIENRSRFILETIDELTQNFPKKNIGIKLTPSGGWNDMGEASKEKIIELYSYLITQLDNRDIGFIQLKRWEGNLDTERGIEVDITEFIPFIKNSYFFANGNFTPEEGERFIAEGKADAIVYGRPFIVNPDYEFRIFNSIPVKLEHDSHTWYEFPEGKPYIGYTDYPLIEA